MSPIRARSSMVQERSAKIVRSPCARVTLARSVRIVRPFDTHPDARWNGPQMAAIDTPFPVARPRYTGILEWITTVDHKRIGILYLWTTFFFFVTGGLLALAVRAQLATPDGKILDAQAYNGAFTMHGTTMIFLFVVPVDRIRELHHPVADRRSGHGLPEAERAVVLAPAGRRRHP